MNTYFQSALLILFAAAVFFCGWFSRGERIVTKTEQLPSTVVHETTTVGFAERVAVPKRHKPRGYSWTSQNPIEPDPQAGVVDCSQCTCPPETVTTIKNIPYPVKGVTESYPVEVQAPFIQRFAGLKATWGYLDHPIYAFEAGYAVGSSQLKFEALIGIQSTWSAYAGAGMRYYFR